MTETALAKLDTAKRVLANTRDIEVILKIRVLASTVKEFAKAQGDHALWNAALDAKLRSEIRAGELLKEKVVLGELHSGRKKAHVVPILKRFGIERVESQRWQNLADIPEKPREEYLSKALRKSQAGLLHLARQFKIAQKIRVVNPSNQIRILNEDFRTPKIQLEPNSFHFLFTDPPYGDLELWDDLASFASRVLVPGGFLATYTPHFYLPQIIPKLARTLNFYWIGGIWHTHGETRMWDRKIWVQWKPILLFSKGEAREHDWFSDMVKGDPGDKTRTTGHKWAQGIEEAKHFISKLTMEGEKVLDPMCGSGTIPKAAHLLQREALGYEKDPEEWGKAVASL